MGVEFHHPVAHDLHRDPAEPGRRGAGRPVIDRGQGQKAPRLRAVLGRAGDRAQRLGIKVCPERNRHGEPPSFATLNQTCLKPTRPNRVTPSGTWYKAPLPIPASLSPWQGRANWLLAAFGIIGVAAFACGTTLLVLGKGSQSQPGSPSTGVATASSGERNASQAPAPVQGPDCRVSLARFERLTPGMS